MNPVCFSFSAPFRETFRQPQARRQQACLHTCLAWVQVWISSNKLCGRLMDKTMNFWVQETESFPNFIASNHQRALWIQPRTLTTRLPSAGRWVHYKDVAKLQYFNSTFKNFRTNGTHTWRRRTDMTLSHLHHFLIQLCLSQRVDVHPNSIFQHPNRSQQVSSFEIFYFNL